MQTLNRLRKHPRRHFLARSSNRITKISLDDQGLFGMTEVFCESDCEAIVGKLLRPIPVSCFDVVRLRSIDNVPFLFERKLRHFWIRSNNGIALAVKLLRPIPVSFSAVRLRSFDNVPFLFERKLRHFFIGSNNRSSLAVKLTPIWTNNMETKEEQAIGNTSLVVGLLTPSGYWNAEQLKLLLHVLLSIPVVLLRILGLCKLKLHPRRITEMLGKVLDRSFTGDISLKEESEHGEHGEPTVLDLLHFE
ncbi:hypothetical protein IEQ34_019861 [Dendrobium chrysotoxum]|uniref:Uncharacterized protein n=1 Tax=Dendrobium chrysotoxum TaxID=161865 RepID=A0AAV7G8H0_DENCH|nr:hypothetical protein IEQ34_019861 [Dendrobium chrysotoxum]